MISRLVVFLVFSATAIAVHGARLVNLSVRSSAGVGSETLIVGFVIGGTGTKSILLRGVGPSLVPMGVPNVVLDPQLALFSGQTEIDRNNDWGGADVLANAFTQLGAFPLPIASKDAVMYKSLQRGVYTAHLVSSSQPAVALVECYDADVATSGTYLANISARSMAGTGSNVLTVGFVIAGEGAKTVLIRGIGPALVRQGVTGALVRPVLRLFDSKGVAIAQNTRWSSHLSPVFEAVGAFDLPRGSTDAALFFALPAGVYTAQLHGLGNTVGTGLVEVYAVENSPVSFLTLEPVTAAPPPLPVDAGAGALSPGPDVAPVAKIRIPPIYPSSLVQAGVTGEVLVEFYVKSDGTVANAVAIIAPDARFAWAAVAAIEQWIFEPGRKDGKLVTTRMQQPISFSIEEQ